MAPHCRNVGLTPSSVFTTKLQNNYNIRNNDITRKKHVQKFDLLFVAHENTIVFFRKEQNRGNPVTQSHGFAKRRTAGPPKKIPPTPDPHLRN